MARSQQSRKPALSCRGQCLQSMCSHPSLQMVRTGQPSLSICRESSASGLLCAGRKLQCRSMHMRIGRLGKQNRLLQPPHRESAGQATLYKILSIEQIFAPNGPLAPRTSTLLCTHLFDLQRRSVIHHLHILARSIVPTCNALSCWHEPLPCVP
jgi:hypothetical protein